VENSRLLHSPLLTDMLTRPEQFILISDGDSLRQRLLSLSCAAVMHWLS